MKTINFIFFILLIVTLSAEAEDMMIVDVRSNIPLSDRLNFTIRDVQGRIVFEAELKAGENSWVYEWNAGGGVYFAEITGKDIRRGMKIVRAE